MFCRFCGKAIPETAQYCTYCGRRVARRLDVINDFARKLVPGKLSAMFPSVMPVFFLGVYAVIAVAIIAVISTFGGHDLSGTYHTSKFFPVDSFTFNQDGTFKAYSSNINETYWGRYNKKARGGYSLKFAAGTAGTENPVTQYEASTIGVQMELEVKKTDTSALRVTVIPKIGYYAWAYQETLFYFDGSF